MQGAMSARAQAGLSVHGAPLGTSATGQPLTGLPAMQEFAAGFPTMDPYSAADLFLKNRAQDIAEQQITGVDRREYQRVYSDAAKRLAEEQLPGGRIRTPNEIAELARREADSYLGSFRRAGQIFGGQQPAGAATLPPPHVTGAAPAPTQPPATTPAAPGGLTPPPQVAPGQAQSGSEEYLKSPVFDWLHSGMRDADFWMKVRAHDMANPGFMQRVGPELINEFNRVRGAQALRNLLNRGPLGTIGWIYRQRTGTTTEEDLVRDSLRRYLGMVRSGVDFPDAAGGPLHPGAIKGPVY
jgi:hypothetical protein